MHSRVYSVPARERIYGGYAVTIDGALAPVSEVRCSSIPFNRRWPGHQRQIEQTELCGMVRFAFDGRAAVSVTADRDFREVKVRPLSRGVKIRRDGRTVSFEINRPGGYSVEFDGYHNNLHVFADAFASANAKFPVPGSQFSVSSTGTDSQTDKLSNCQTGVADALRRDGNAIVFGPGVHDIGILTLKSGDTVLIDPGAVVYGGFHAKEAEDIAIVGCGIIDGGHLKEEILFEASGDGTMDVHNAKRKHTVDFRNCRRIRIDGPAFRDSLLYSIAMWGCEDIDVRNVKIVGQWRFNTDGIDLHNCRRGRVSDCFARTFDDTFCFKAHEGYGNCEDGVFERCVAWNDWGKAFEVGVECRAEHLRRLAFRDCDCIHAVGAVMDVANVDYGRVSDVLFEEIRVECDEPMPDQQFQRTDDSAFDASAGLDRLPRLFQAEVWYSHEYSNEYGGKWSGGGFIDGVTVRGVSAYSSGRVSQIGMRIAALDAGHRPEHIVVEGVSLDGRTVDGKNGVVLSLSGPAAPPTFAAPRLRWYKGNLHCHTYMSDGRAFPEQVLARYREAGFDFCAITDHNRLGRETDFWRKVADGDTEMAYVVSRRNFDIYRASCPWAEVRDNDGATEVRIQPLDAVRARFEAPGEFLVLPGVEISRGAKPADKGGRHMHMVYVGLEAIAPETEQSPYVREMETSDMSEIIREARVEVASLAAELGNPPHLCILCHPFWRYYDILAQDVIDNPDVRFFEVCNKGACFAPAGGLPDDGRYGERLWDAVNAVRAKARQPLLYAVASDDCHFYPGTGTTRALGLGTAFTVVRAEALTPTALFGAMERGDFYASNGVMLDDVRFDRETGEFMVCVRPKAGVSHTVSFIATKRDADTGIAKTVHIPWNGPRDSTGRPERYVTVYSPKVGATVREVRGGKGEALVASYTLAPDDLYVRARVESDEPAPYYAAGNTAPMHPKFATAWTQPYSEAAS